MNTSMTHRAVHLPRFNPLSWLETAFAVWRERQALGELDDARLEDLGLSRQDAWTEANRPFWDLPR